MAVGKPLGMEAVGFFSPRPDAMLPVPPGTVTSLGLRVTDAMSSTDVGLWPMHALSDAQY